MKKFNIAIIGATGVVGRTLIDILHKRNFPINCLYLLASSNSNGKMLNINKKEYIVQDVNDFNFNLVDIAFGCAGSEVTKLILKKVQQTECILIDEASFLRKIASIPLIVPEINAELIKNYKTANIIASPNCCAVPIAILLHALSKLVQIKRVSIATYQSYSGAGKVAVDNFLQLSSLAMQNLQSNSDSINNINLQSDLINDNSLQKNIYLQNIEHQLDKISFNIMPKIGSNITESIESFALDKLFHDELCSKKDNISSLDNELCSKKDNVHTSSIQFFNYTTEEEKIISEVQKLLSNNINISVTSTRVPVLVGHSFACNIEFEDEITDDMIAKIKLHFNCANNSIKYDENILSPKEIMGTDFVYISRIRRSPFDLRVLDIWCMCDNLRKGAALNLAQIAENLIIMI